MGIIFPNPAIIFGANGSINQYDFDVEKISCFIKCILLKKKSKTLNILVYNAAYKAIPPNLFTQPIIANCTVFSTNFAPNFTIKITAIITKANDKNGNQ